MNRRSDIAGGGDDALLQRVLTHVLGAQVRGQLPQLPWDLGLSPHEASEIRARWPKVSWARLDDASARAEPPPLLQPMHEWLRSHRADSDAVHTVLANLLAVACFGSHHLWQDLGASGRDEVSQLMAWGFPTLHASNHLNLKWKRHLFLELGERTGHHDLRPPKCDHCDHFEACFGDLPPGAEPGGATRRGESVQIPLTDRSHSS